MARTSRNTGLDILNSLFWGTHFSLFYETKQDLLDILIPYFKAGLERNEFCLWVLADRLTPEEARGALKAGLPEAEQHLARGDIQLVTFDEWFGPPGEFNVETVIGRFKDKSREAAARGYAGMRVEGSPAWLAMKDSTQFSEFEAATDRLVANARMILLCSFPLGESGADDILNIADMHQFTIARRRGVWEIIEAPKPQPRSDYLTPRESEVLAWVARGKSTWQIAKILDIAKRTVDEHVHNATRKLGAANRTQAVAIAIRHRLIEVGDPMTVREKTTGRSAFVPGAVREKIVDNA